MSNPSPPRGDATGYKSYNFSIGNDILTIGGQWLTNPKQGPRPQICIKYQMSYLLFTPNHIT